MKTPISVLAVLLCFSGCTDSQAAPAKAKVRSHRFGPAQKEIFSDIARSVVGAYEALGRLDARYDSQGDCGGGASDPGSEEDYCSIWRFSSSNPTLRVRLTHFEPTAKDSPQGYYQGWARFVDSATRQPRRIGIRLTYTGDDVDVRLRVKPVPKNRTAAASLL